MGTLWVVWANKKPVLRHPKRKKEAAQKGREMRRVPFLKDLRIQNLILKIYFLKK
jgi:hypothetical protein